MPADIGDGVHAITLIKKLLCRLSLSKRRSLAHSFLSLVRLSTGLCFLMVSWTSLVVPGRRGSTLEVHQISPLSLEAKLQELSSVLWRYRVEDLTQPPDVYFGPAIFSVLETVKATYPYVWN